MVLLQRQAKIRDVMQAAGVAAGLAGLAAALLAAVGSAY